MCQGMTIGAVTALAVIFQIAPLTPAERELLGIWEVVEVTEEGKVQNELAKARVTFRGPGEFDWNEGEVVTPDGERGRAVWWLMPKEGKNAIAFGFSLLAKPGIYKLEGDTLTMCFSGRGERKPPKAFSGSKDSGCSLWRLKRVK